MSQPYRKRSPETWTAARDAWIGGLTAGETCAWFDLGVSTFHKRAREEGWRRVDQEDPEPEDVPRDEDLPDIDDEALAAFTFRRMSVEARRGRLSRALASGRLRDMAAPPPREVQKVLAVHPAAPLSRADRLRLAAQARKTGPP